MVRERESHRVEGSLNERSIEFMGKTKIRETLIKRESNIYIYIYIYLYYVIE